MKTFCCIVSIVLAFSFRVTAQRVEFPAPFAPSPDWVKPSEKPYRQSLCLNGLWQFQPVTLGSDFKEGVDPTPELPPADDRGWDKTPIRIPSPWNVNSFADKNGQGGDFRCYPSYPREWEAVKMGWLRKKFKVPADWKGRRVSLHFEAVAGDAEILVNGRPAGHHFGIFLPFDIDVTGLVEFGKENELRIGVRKASLFDRRSEYGRRTYQAGSFWGQHIAGIWQDVELVALPTTHISEVYVKPLVGDNRLEVELAITNEGTAASDVLLDGGVYRWKAVDGDALAPSLEMPAVTVRVPAGATIHTTFTAMVNRRLQLWSPDTPALYGLVVRMHLGGGGRILDSKYTRFGWRETALRGGQFLLNGQSFVMKGDSWHFLGIPQMTRRYAAAWFQAMRDAHLNTVRLHAQPYPSFYLDVADEMGILVLDETAVWASDGGPRLNDPAYWKDSEIQLAEQIRRDRNHPAVFGWSVSNEVMPIVRGVMHDPPGMKDNLVKYYGVWAEICRRLDPTRPWISADGEDDGEGRLPVYIVHYGGTAAMDRAEKSGKPWGVGEAGNAYYATPQQVAETNGPRAYESFPGRMEGVAASSWSSLMAQRERHAIYRSVFNLVWYGLRPLPLGMKDTTRPPALTDGIFFPAFEEGRPGVQPERLGPYCTTLNPGYDPSLPLYRTWPLFDAIRDASAEPAVTADTPFAARSFGPGTFASAKQPSTTSAISLHSIKVLSAPGGRLAAALKRTGVPVNSSVGRIDPAHATTDDPAIPLLLFVDGEAPPARDQRGVIQQVLAGGGTVVVWGTAADKLAALNELLAPLLRQPFSLTLTSRTASSLDLVTPDPLTAGLTAADLYFSELRPPEIVTMGLEGPLVQQGAILLRAANTNWLQWNKQPEYAKTAMILRSELEAKPSGAVLIKLKTGGGTLVVTTLPAAPRLAKAEKAIRVLLSNMGIGLGTGSDAGMPLLKSGDIVRVLACGSWPVDSISEGAGKSFVDLSHAENIRAGGTTDDRPWALAYNENGVLDLSQLKWKGPAKNAIVYLSFWVSSPRNIDDLLVEPDIPTVGLEVAADDAMQVWLNGGLIVNNIRKGSIEGGKKVVPSIRLRQGWNHFLIKLIHSDRGWQFSGRLTSNQPEFLEALSSALEKP